MEYIIQLIPFILIFGIFWFFLIRPQRQKQQNHQEMLDNLKEGDEVYTIGGIKAKIINIKDNIIKLRIASDVDIEVKKDAIGQLDNQKDNNG